MKIGVVGTRTGLGRRVLELLGDDGLDEPPIVAGLDAVVVVTPSLPVLDAAVEAEVAYIDASADPDWVAEVLRRHVDAPVPVVPACGFDGLLGDLAAAVAAEHFGGPVDELAVHHDRDVALASTPGRPRRVSFPNGNRFVVDTTFVERVLVPRHVPGATVTTTLAAIAGVTSRFVGQRRTTFQVVAEATGPGPKSFVVCHGDGVEAVGARFLATAARHLTVPGAMAPAEAFLAEPFLDAVSGDDLHWSFEFPAASFGS